MTLVAKMKGSNVTGMWLMHLCKIKRKGKVMRYTRTVFHLMTIVLIIPQSKEWARGRDTDTTTASACWILSKSM